MSRIELIQAEKNGIRIWTIGSDDFFIHEEDLKLLRRSITMYHSKKLKETLWRLKKF